MGTAAEWTQVLEYGGIFAVAMLLLAAIRDREGVARLPNLFATTVSAVVVGMLDVFRWRVLHGAIAQLFVGVLLVAFGTGFGYPSCAKASRNRFKAGLTHGVSVSKNRRPWAHRGTAREGSL
jgi:hypothetical protein